MTQDAFFLDRSGAQPTSSALWPAVVIPKEALDQEVERLASGPRPANGRRRSLIVHPANKISSRTRAGDRAGARRAAAGRTHGALPAELDPGKFHDPGPTAIR